MEVEVLVGEIGVGGDVVLDPGDAPLRDAVRCRQLVQPALDVICFQRRHVGAVSFDGASDAEVETGQAARHNTTSQERLHGEDAGRRLAVGARDADDSHGVAGMAVQGAGGERHAQARVLYDRRRAAHRDLDLAFDEKGASPVGRSSLEHLMGIVMSALDGDEETAQVLAPRVLAQ